METRYLKINYEQALSARKELLSAELNSLNIVKKLKEYKELRKKEFFLKNKLRIALFNLKTKTNLILSTFPEDSSNISKPKKSKRENSTNKNIQDELEEISKKLEGLR